MKENNQFKVIVLGIIFNPKTRKILIGRRENDPQIPNLSWCFPGGKLLPGDYVDKILKEKIKKKTGYEVENLGVVFTKAYPENERIIAIYFLCEVLKGKEKAGDDLKELTWVVPKELEKRFTTSFHPQLKEYILNLK
jgi:ADP-ribose pyrophosphatase YjhB (NUDIX family)